MNPEKNNQSTYVWNSIASVLNSFLSAIILMVISQVAGIYEAGIFTIAYAIANLAMMVGKFGMRQFQVSDLSNKYSYKEYLFSRKISVIIMIFFFVIYTTVSAVIYQYTLEKACIIFFWCVIRIVDAYEDVFHAELQKNNYLDKASKIISIRLLGVIILFSLSFWIKKNLIYATIICCIYSITISIILNKIANKKYIRNLNGSFSIKNSFFLLKECFTLFISSFFLMYIANAPRYSIDGLLGEEEQAIFSYIFMPVFVISLFSTFIFNPLIVEYANLWDNKNLYKIKKKVFNQISAIIIITVICIIGGKIIGLYLLGIMFATDLSAFDLELTILLIAGGFLALISYFQMLLTVMRMPLYILWGYIGTFTILFFSSNTIVKIKGITGISLFYAGCMLLLTLFFFTIIFRIIKINKNIY